MRIEKTRLLFVCIENSYRSQIAEAFARIYGGEEFEVFSAGSRPSGKVHPTAIATMKEIGYDLTTHHSKSLDDLPREMFDYVVTMGCGDECPFIPTHHRVEWDIPDPKGLPVDEVRIIRDDIGIRVKSLIGKR